MRLSASDIGTAYYLGVSVYSEIQNTKRLMRKLQSFGLSKLERKGAVKNVQS